ncbi:MAG: UDP-N-acetylglucosamine 2-epimerase, partial [Promethearchaeota archaeon]
NEYFNISRADYKKILRKSWDINIELFNNLLKSNLPKLNYIWRILEVQIKSELTKLLEQLNYVISILSREKPDLIIFSQSNSNLASLLLTFEIDNLLFVKSKIDFIFSKISNLLDYFFGFKNNLKTIFLHIFRRTRFNIKSHEKKENLVGVLLPKDYLLKGTASIIKALNKYKEINVKKIHSDFFKFQSSFLDLKFRFVLPLIVYLKIEKYFKSNKIKNSITKYISKTWKSSYFHLLKEVFYEWIIYILYWHYKVDKELHNNDYKVILNSNEYFSEIKVWIFICQKKGIRTLFIPHVGIPNDIIYITARYSDIIYVEGENDKNFLLTFEINPDKIKVIGSPKYEDILSSAHKPITYIKDYFSKKTYYLKGDKKIILLTTSPIHPESNRILLTKVVNVLRNFEKEIQFIIKLHPREDGINHQQILKKLNFQAIFVKDVNIFDIIKTADILLTQDSAVILDSMVMGTPLISLDLINKRFNYSGYYNYNNEEILYKVANEHELFNILDTLLHDKNQCEKYKTLLKNKLSSIILLKENYSPIKRIVDDILNELKID